ncbi:MAG: ribosome-associated translation inhibitor RaiA [Bacteroidota bacterium]
MQVQINAVHFKADQKLLDLIQERLGKLELFYDRIIDAQVFLKLESHGNIKEKVTEISLKVPGDRLFSQGTDRSFEVALDRAVEGLRRSLKKYKERRRN